MESAVKNKKKYPFGFYVCSLSYTLERMAFYSSKWLIGIFIVTAVAKGGLGLTDSDGAKMIANLVAFTYVTPIIGGFIADKWLSPRLCVPIGTVLMGLGYMCGWQASAQTSISLVWLMIVLVSIGTGLFKGNLSGISGRLFDNKEELDGAFSVQYSFVNIGAFIGTTFVSFIAFSSVGFGGTFLICAILLFLDTIWFVVGGKTSFGDVGKKPFKINENNDKSQSGGQRSSEEPLNKKDKLRIGAIVFLTVFSIAFWLVYYLASLPILYHWGPDFAEANKANWMIGNFRVPSAWFDSLNSLSCIILGPILAMVWNKRARSPKGDLSMFKKTAIGMVLLGLSFAVMALAEVVRGDGQASLIWIIMFGVLMTLGEMVFSPLGNSFISKFSPGKVLGLMLGIWPLAVFIAAKAHGYVYELLTKFSFAPGYATVGAVVIVCGIVLWSFDKKLSKLVED
ncbi:peptide MFS transporter [Paraclostridium ghonii]|uniref:Dipeptide/tripeptide permease n=1 Tax=Paraclostridium ghonii TaxID=29358 RepID=A0ABU0N0D7_9FIRM|nr:peptide MFS transporter [Paeniclostridium ghonii]MDQ0556328.1 dipeptide/tripeptide permease [Paeniclostridium ghonii]